jgi:DNA-binding IclR family transcriptional regulator
MEAFEVGESTLSLAELSRRAHMHKSTALRLARTLALSQYMVQADGGQWRLGPAAGWLGARYQAGFDVNNVVEPALHELVKATSAHAWRGSKGPGRCGTTCASENGCR